MSHRGIRLHIVSAQAQAPLLATKLHAPDARDRLVRRVLLDRLTGASRAKLVLVRAPAGWGKSTLMSQWRVAEAGRREFAWVTLDRRDSDPVRFWTYVIESLRLRPRSEPLAWACRCTGVVWWQKWCRCLSMS